MSFCEERIEKGFIPYGARGGAGYSTNVVIVNSGFEQRNKNWENSRGRWEYGERNVTEAELHSIEGFFRARNGRFQGFRYKDWANFKVTAEPLTEHNVTTQGIIGTPDNTDGLIENQLYKKTSSGDDGLGNPFVEYRRISKPSLPNSARIFVNGTEIFEGTNYEIDLSTGLLTFSLTIATEDEVTWTGEFDTPVRFDADEFQAQFIAGQPAMTDPPDFSEVYFHLFSLPLVEIRV